MSRIVRLILIAILMTSCVAVALTSQPTNQPGLVITRLAAQRSGDTVTITGTVQNVGHADLAANEGTIGFTVNGQTTTHDLPPLGVKKSATFTVVIGLGTTFATWTFSPPLAPPTAALTGASSPIPTPNGFNWEYHLTINRVLPNCSFGTICHP